jgi:hypothetical protein
MISVHFSLSAESSSLPVQVAGWHANQREFRPTRSAQKAGATTGPPMLQGVILNVRLCNLNVRLCGCAISNMRYREKIEFLLEPDREHFDDRPLFLMTFRSLYALTQCKKFPRPFSAPKKRRGVNMSASHRKPEHTLTAFGCCTCQHNLRSNSNTS